MLLAAAAWGQNTPAKPDTKPDAQPNATTPAAAKLALGDKAPPLAAEKWIKGEPITGFEKGKVYVVEFWATWCGPCKTSIPHLTELQKKYKDKDVRIIGANVWEQYNDKTLEKVEKFVADFGEKMEYTVAYDGKSKTIDKAYMKAAGQDGIPTAFIVDREGRVAYIGHPMEMDEPLAKIVDGKFDIDAAKKDFADREAKEKAAMSGMAKLRAFSAQYGAFLKNKEYDKAYELARKTLDGDLKDNPQVLNEIAWLIVDPTAKVEKKDLDLAMTAATRANELTKGKDAAILDTLARVHFEKGDKAKALELQKKAVELAPEQLKSELEASLKEYEKAAGNK
ncbi:MAG: redoxin family protein [Phycisphaerales bacterium]|nr:redoxin family protein [Phycisphaerales bacterium]